jgi:Zn-dependent protease with chaperone function
MAQCITTTPSAHGESLKDLILNGFEGELPRLRTPLHYRLGLLLVAIAMVLLPLIYIGVIALTGYGIFWYATHATGVFGNVHGRSAIVALVVYLGPLVAGGILILFMIKPLFAGKPKQAKPRILSPDAEPLLFEFVRRLCRSVGAPMASEIRVDSEVNASASFRRGWLTLLKGDLALTIGLPLAAGFNLSQLAGVLAHEFGHFAQRAGMRTTYVIRSISFWFMRVVYERDAWDEQLVAWSKESDIRIGIIFYAARFFVWITRKILWALMMIGHVISCFMLREMEYDADRHEAWLAGSKTFESTARRLVELSVAQQLAQRDLGTFWNEGRLPDDLPGLGLQNTVEFKEDIGKFLRERIDESRTGWFDMHPCDADRIARARAEQANGIYHLDQPAQVLFSDFKSICRAASLDLYRQVLGKKFKEESVRPLEELVARKHKERAGGEALKRYFQGRLSPLRPLPLSLTLPPLADSPADALKTRRDRMLSELPAYEKQFKTYDDADTRLLQTHRVTALLQANARISAKDFSLPQPTAEAARLARNQCAILQQDMAAQLRTFEETATERLLLSLSFLRDPALAPKIAQSEELSAEADRIMPATRRLGELMPSLTELRNEQAALACVAELLKDNQDNATLVNAIRNRMGRVLKHLGNVQAALSELPYPFDHAGGPITLRKQVLPHLPGPDNLGGIYEAAVETVNQLYELYFRCMGRLAWISEQVETAAGLEPLPEPKEEEEKKKESLK